jgi:hypothetical protein
MSATRSIRVSHLARTAAALALAVCAVAVQVRLVDNSPQRNADDLLYLPNERLLNHFTAGLGPVVADYLWVQCCTYVGRQVQTEWDFQWVRTMVQTVVRLDPYFVPAYRYGAMFLTSLKQEPDAALELLHRGMVLNPDAWELPYEAAMIYLMNYKDQPDARYNAAFYLALSVDTGNAPAYVVETAASLQGKYNLIGLERKMWEAMANSEDGLLRDLAHTKLEEVRIRQNMDVLNEVLERYRVEQGAPADSLDDLVTRGYMKDIPGDIFGGRYLLGPDGRAMNSTLLDNQARDQRKVIESAVRKFEAQHGAPPRDLAQLVAEGFMPAQEHPWPGKEWRYEPGRGVVEVSAQQ